jgi:6-phosphogluconolactonase (cycloisomerase 2 family)
MAFDIGPDGLPVPAESYATGGLANNLAAPQDLALDGSERFLFATNNESSDVASFGIAADGTLSAAFGSPFATGFLPIYLAAHPDQPHLYVNNAGQLGVYEIEADGALTEKQIVDGFAAREHQVEPGGRFLYAADVVSGVRGYEISSSGTLTELPGSPYGFDTSRPFLIEVATTGPWVYVLDLDNGIATFESDADGELQLLGQTLLADFAHEIELTGDDHYLYVGFPYEPEIRGFEIGSDGLPSELVGSPFAAEYSVIDLIAPPGTSRLYEITRDLSSIFVFDIAGDGSLTPLGEPVTVAAAGVPGAGAYLRASALEVAIDIKPGSDGNPINLRSRGIIPVAILGSAELDVADVLWAGVRFGPDEAPPAHGGPHELEDVNGDGRLDMMVRFRTQDTGIICGDTEATLTGTLLDGMPFEGTDTFETVGCNSNRPHHGMTNRETEQIRRQRPRLNSEDQRHPGDLVEEQRVD